jgi:hypothetical protein
MKSTRTDHNVHMENPMCSDSTEKKRFRRATLSPLSRQKVSSSGSHSSIQRPLRPLAGLAVLGAVMGASTLRDVLSDPKVGRRGFLLVAPGDLEGTLRSPRVGGG